MPANGVVVAAVAVDLDRLVAAFNLANLHGGRRIDDFGVGIASVPAAVEAPATAVTGKGEFAGVQVEGILRPAKRKILKLHALGAAGADHPVTDMDHHTEHIRKIQTEKRARICKKAGVRIELWTWRKLLQKKGGKARRWEALVEEL